MPPAERDQLGRKGRCGEGSSGEGCCWGAGAAEGQAGAAACDLVISQARWSAADASVERLHDVWWGRQGRQGRRVIGCKV